MGKEVLRVIYMHQELLRSLGGNEQRRKQTLQWFAENVTRFSLQAFCVTWCRIL